MGANSKQSELNKIILVDDHALFREGIKLLIEMEQIGHVVAEADNGQSFIDLLNEYSPDLVILDIDMPVMDGLKATRKALAKMPGLKILVLSMHGNQEYYSGFIDAGVKGFTLKTAGKAEHKSYCLELLRT
jgi:DNA-binding NarL/FixJ family response regulator